MSDRTVAVRLQLTAAQYKAELAKAAASTKAFSAQAASGFKSVTRAAADVGPGVRVGAGIAIAATAAFAVKSVQAYSQVQDATSALEATYGSSAKAFEKWAATQALGYNLSKREALNASMTFANFAKAGGLAGGQLEKFTIDLVQRAADMASYYGGTTADAIAAISSGLMGEAEPLRRYGVLLDDATLRQKALAMGLVTTTKDALTPQTRVLVAQALILEKSSQAAGDAARTQDSLANQIKQATAAWDDTQVAMGETLSTAALPLLKATNSLLGSFNQLPSGVRGAGIAAIAAGAGFLVLAPRIVDSVNGLKTLSASSPRAAAAIGGLGKAIGIAGSVLTVAAAGWALWSMKQAEAQAMGEKFVTTLDKTTGAATQATRVDMAKSFYGIFTSDDLAKTPFTMNQIIDAITQGGSAFTNLRQQAMDWRQAETSGWGAYSYETSRFTGAFITSLDTLNAGFGASTQAQRDLSMAETGGVKVSADAAQRAADLAKKQSDVAAAATAATKATNGLNAAWSAMGAGLDVANALIAQRKAMGEWTASLKDNGATLDISTGKGRANVATLTTTTAAISAMREANIKALSPTMGVARATANADAAARKQVATLRAQFIAAGGSAAAFDRLTGAVGRLPAKKTVTVDVKQTGVPIDWIAAQWAEILRMPTANLNAHFGVTGSTTVKATGGRVSGPGGPREDAIPAMLSNGEYVINAASAQRIGYGNLDALNAYADGGMVRLAAGGRALTARQQAALDKVTSLRGDRTSAIDSAASSMRGTYGIASGFDFGAQAQAVDALAQAQQRLADASTAVASADDEVYAARRAVNSAGTPQERAAAEDQLTKAIKAQTAAKLTVGAETKGVDAAKGQVTATKATAGNILAGWQARLKAVSAFGSNLDALRRKGFSAAMVAEVAGDSNGPELAAALVRATPAQVAALNKTEAGVARASRGVATIAGNAQYNDQIRSAQQAAIRSGVPASKVGALAPVFQVHIAPQRVVVAIGPREIAHAMADYGVRVNQ